MFWEDVLRRIPRYTSPPDKLLEIFKEYENIHDKCEKVAIIFDEARIALQKAVTMYEFGHRDNAVQELQQIERRLGSLLQNYAEKAHTL